MEKKPLSQKYEIGLMVVSLLFVAALVVMLTVWPEKGMAFTESIRHFIIYSMGSVIQFIALGIFVGLIILAMSKYGNIRLGHSKPEYKTVSWVAMMFFCGNGAGTVYWAFLEWGYHFNSAPQLYGSEISEAYAYERSMAYCFYDWGPIAWAMLCVFVLPFAYHYHVMKDDDLRFSALTKHAAGEKASKGWLGKIVDFLFIFSAIGSVAITAGTSGSTIAATIASLLGIENTFQLTVYVLLGVTVIYSITSMSGAKKGMQKISDSNVYLCLAMLLFILIVGPTQQIIDSIVNGIGLMGCDFLRMTTWTAPLGDTSYPKDWTVFYLIYWFVFGPFTGLFVAKISKGRKIKEIIVNMLVSGSAGLFCFFGIMTAYQQYLRQEGILDIPAMLNNGESENIALATLGTLPGATIVSIVYLFVIILFLATTMDAISQTLAQTVSKGLKYGEEPSKAIRFAWCLLLCALPIAIYSIGTDINTIKSIVLFTGAPLLIAMAIIYKGFLQKMFEKFGKMSKEDIIEDGKKLEDEPVEE